MPNKNGNIINEYLKTLNPKQLKGYHIAKNHLESSFDITKSNDFIKWLQSKKTN